MPTEVDIVAPRHPGWGIPAVRAQHHDHVVPPASSGRAVIPSCRLSGPLELAVPSALPFRAVPPHPGRRAMTTDLAIVFDTVTCQNGRDLGGGLRYRWPPLRTSTAIPLGDWLDRADGGLCRGPTEALLRVARNQHDRARASSFPSDRRLADSPSHHESAALVRRRRTVSCRECPGHRRSESR